MFYVNEDGKVEGRSCVVFLTDEIGTELGPCDGLLYGGGFLKL